MKSNVFAGDHLEAAIRMFNLFDEDIPVTLASNTGLRIGHDGQFLINTHKFLPNPFGLPIERKGLEGFIVTKLLDPDSHPADTYSDGSKFLSLDDALEFAFVEYARKLAAEAIVNLVLERGHFSH